MPAFHFAVPGNIESLTGGYAYARRIMAEWSAAGVDAGFIGLPDGFPFPSGAALDESFELLSPLPSGAVVLTDGLAYGALPADLLASLDLRLAALVHHPLALETGLTEQVCELLYRSEHAALKCARHVVVTSPATARELARSYNVGPDRVTIALPGVDEAERAIGAGDVAHILSVGTLTPRKGFDVLVEALAAIRDLDWTCTIAGSADRHPPTTLALKAAIIAHGLDGRVTIAGEVPARELDDLYRRADIFALASRYEGYGMVFAEALSRGLPIVACDAGAIPDTVPAETGILARPDDPEGFSAALRRLIADVALRRRMADAAWAHAARLPRWRDAARLIADAMGELV
jgi:glycosyltransferase involved in cell wall biosynthesis